MQGKPEPVSYMFKNLRDVETGIIFAIELQEGKEAMPTKDFVKDGEKATTACTLRLMRCLAGQGVILHVDSLFASLNTLQKAREQGNYFTGFIKTSHSGIPEKYLRGLFPPQSIRGET